MSLALATAHFHPPIFTRSQSLHASHRDNDPPKLPRSDPQTASSRPVRAFAKLSQTLPPSSSRTVIRIRPAINVIDHHVPAGEHDLGLVTGMGLQVCLRCCYTQHTTL